VAVLCFVSLGLSDAATQTEEWAASRPEALSVTLSTDKADYKIGSQILVMIRQRNNSPVNLVTSLLGAAIDYDLLIKRGSVEMKSAPLGARTTPVVTAPIRPHRQAPGTEVVERGTKGNFSPISDWGLNINEPGTYVIVAIERETKQKSNPVTITIAK